MTQDDGHCCFDDWARSDLQRARRRRGEDRVTRHLLAAMNAAGLAGRSVLDIGCGAGGLALGAVSLGASSATGMDLGVGAVESARTLAVERGFESRTRFLAGDGSTSTLQSHDVVALNRVICCYPHAENLLSNTLGATRHVYAFVVPRANGVAGGVARSLLAMGNLWFRLRRSRYGDYRAFVHDVRQIDRQVRDAGLTPVQLRSVSYIWHLAVYERVGPESTSN